MKARPIVAGIDVGGNRKGFHGVALRGGQPMSRLRSTDPSVMADWSRHVGALVIAIDATGRFGAWMAGHARQSGS